jgi:hypothetical protein
VSAFVALLMTMAAFALVGYPLLRPRRGEGGFLSTNHRGTEDLLAQRDAAYAAIKELEFEFHLGNLSQQDYDDLRARYRQRAAAILRQLDAAELEAAAASEKSATGPSRDGGAAEEIERAVALLRQQLDGNALLICPACHNRVHPDDRFCGRCGARLPPTTAAGRSQAGDDR